MSAYQGGRSCRAALPAFLTSKSRASKFLQERYLLKTKAEAAFVTLQWHVETTAGETNQRRSHPTADRLIGSVADGGDLAGSLFRSGFRRDSSHFKWEDSASTLRSSPSSEPSGFDGANRGLGASAAARSLSLSRFKLPKIALMVQGEAVYPLQINGLAAQ